MVPTADLELDPLRHTEPMKLVAHDSCQSAVVFLRARDNNDNNNGIIVLRSNHSSNRTVRTERLDDSQPTDWLVLLLRPSSPLGGVSV